MATYGDRNEVLASLGFANYAAYLASDLWKGIKARAWSEKGDRCALCPKLRDVLHHLRYDRSLLAGENLSWLFPLCHGCHLKVEFKRKGKQKRTLAEAQQVFSFMLLTRNRQIEKSKGSRRGWCKTCGRKAAKKMWHCRPCLAAMRLPRGWVDAMDGVTVTWEFLEAGCTGPGGYKREQLEIVGVPWPPLCGWKHAVVGRVISKPDAQRFLDLKGKGVGQKVFDTPAPPPLRPWKIAKNPWDQDAIKGSANYKCDECQAESLHHYSEKDRAGGMKCPACGSRRIQPHASKLARILRRKGIS